jgi:SAM-dependent methyltransferase
MQESEFDRFADEYRQTHAKNIRMSGEEPEFFAEYKVRSTRRAVDRSSLRVERILDFGAGVGNSIPFFRKWFPNAVLSCADVSGKSLDVARARFPDAAELLRIESASLPAVDASYDLAFSACVFHHIAPAEHLGWLEEMKRVVRPGGMLALFEHNPWNPLTVRAVKDCPFDVNAKLLSMPELKRKALAAGWPNVAHEFCVFFPGSLAALRPLERLLTRLPLGAQYALFALRT